MPVHQPLRNLPVVFEKIFTKRTHFWFQKFSFRNYWRSKLLSHSGNIPVKEVLMQSPKMTSTNQQQIIWEHFRQGRWKINMKNFKNH